MRIASSEIHFSSQHTLVEEHTRREELVAGVSSNGAWEPDTLRDGAVRTRELQIDQSQPAGSTPTLLDEYLNGRSLDSLRAQIDSGTLTPDATAGISLPDLESVRQGLSALGSTARADLIALLFQVAEPVDAVTPLDAEVLPGDQFRMQLIQAAVEAFSGRKLHILTPADLNLSNMPKSGEMSGPTGDTTAPSEGGSAEPTFGLRYRYQETHYERETSSFRAEGTVRTADGQEIDVDVSLTMGRQFAREESMEVSIGGALQDPLVVNFEGTAAELTERTYHFDLDTDGEAEQIHFVGPNSGFLALDRDGSGTIDNGSELFGVESGNGFADLAAFDEDGNQFIDEGDSVYEGLRIWQKDDAGNNRLLALGQSGIGAIYLGHHSTPFQVKDDSNQLQGVVRSSGIYLVEGGGTGTVQQLDLVV